MAAQKTEKEQRFDQVKLQAMHEPLTVRVEKMRGNVRQPIELPAKGSEQQGFSPPGTNWTRDEVLQLENFILTKWAGGGYYEFTVTDAKGETMRWQGVWDPRMYPEKVPPNTAEAALVGAATNVQQVSGPANIPQNAQPLGMNQTSGWPPNGAQLGYGNPPHSGPVMGQQPAPQMPQPQSPPMWAAGPQPWPGNTMQPGPWGYPQQPQPYNGYPPPGYAPPGYGAAPGYGTPPYGGRTRFGYDDDDRNSRRGARFFDNNDDDKEKKELERRLQQADLDRKELEYKQALERQTIAHEQSMAAMREEIRRLGEGRNKNEDDEVRRLREEREREREQARTQHENAQRELMQQQLLAIRQQSEQAMLQLRADLARMAESPKGETDEFRRIREEQQRQAQEFERQRQEQERRLEAERAERERERERFEQIRRDEMLQREMKETREASERRFEQMQQAALSNRQDPVVEMMKENARMNADTQREIARMQNESNKSMSQFMVSPVQLAQLMKDSSSGTDGMMRGIINSVGEIGNLYKNAAETIMNMSGGGGDPPAARLIQEGLARGSEVAERFLAVKRDQVISEGKVKTAEAMRDQTRIQAEVAIRAQNIAASQGRAPAGWSPPPPIVNAQSRQQQPQQQPRQQQPQQAAAGGGLNGAAPVANGNGAPKPPAGPIDPYANIAQATPVVNTGAIDPYAPPPAPPNNTGPSEEEMFGITLESVHRLRRGVAEGKLTPDKTIDAILQGVEHVVTNQLIVPAFVLFQTERWADFID
ncbi:MAG: hypothetical protein JWO36_3420, partial [Myxococcales bacterium]|nr:hypothetical protein [Myxococcales bacterium]